MHNKWSFKVKYTKGVCITKGIQTIQIIMLKREVVILLVYFLSPNNKNQKKVTAKPFPNLCLHENTFSESQKYVLWKILNKSCVRLLVSLLVTAFIYAGEALSPPGHIYNNNAYTFYNIHNTCSLNVQS